MHEEIKKLIDIAKENGELTQRQKEIILNKAVLLGEDKYEVEMWLETISTKMQRHFSSDHIERKVKCPNCGAIVPSFSAVCTECGFELRKNVQIASSQRLFEMLLKVDEERPEPTALSGFLESLGLEKSRFGVDNVTRKKQTIIQNFPIPTTKDDILEFLSMSVPNATYLGNRFMNGLNTARSSANRDHNNLVPAWKAKCEQVIRKGLISLKNDSESVALLSEYAKQLGIKIKD